MGKPVKLSDRNTPWFQKRTLKRPKAHRNIRKRILIVCEGIKTEPNYFETIRSALPPNIVSLDIAGEGANTLSLVQRARELRERKVNTDYPYDEVWVVFDRDSFSADYFDNAITSAQSDGMKCAWSNEAFELWYILHFEYRNSGMIRMEYQHTLGNYLNERYQKNTEDMYSKLSRLGDQKQAIVFARRLFGDFQRRNIPPSQSNPCTTVYQLIEELNKYLPVR